MRYGILLILILNMMTSCNSELPKVGPNIVFVVGDEEYRSEESMPMLGSILERELNAQVSICYSVDSLGFVDPNRTDHIEGLEKLADADLMVLFTRFRNLPEMELNHITNYAESGKPMVGFRTSTHAFRYEEDSTKFHMNNEWPISVFGQQWITHHGHFEDGHKGLTAVQTIESMKNHKILNGVIDFEAFSWLYHVDGGAWKLGRNCKPLLKGRSLKSNHEINDRLEEFPLENPVAWTNIYNGTSDTLNSRVFFTTLGHPFDFKEETMRKLSLNGIYWALGLEDEIPDSGVNATYSTPYNPNNSGFGEKFKKGMRPLQVDELVKK